VILSHDKLPNIYTIEKMSLSITIQPATYDDIDAMARISDNAFELDRHTQMKELGKVPYSQYDVMAYDCMPQWLSSERVVLLKAVDDSTREIVGWSCWGFRGFEKDDIPRADPGARKEVEKHAARVGDAEKKKEEEETRADGEEPDGVARLEEMTGADMNRWMEKTMPAGTKCMFVVSLSVGPEFQSRGVGGALLKWGTDTADKAGVFIWVHSSESAWKTYAKHGFEVVETLDINLDDWSPAPPPNEEVGAKWGHYIFRYMRREALPT
jgi:GNAT superfamily N-acetyltransferase